MLIRWTLLGVALLGVPMFLLYGDFETSVEDKKPEEPLPRLLPMAPDKALKSFQLRPGFRMELVASEPTVRDPMAGAIDEDGRFFVVEYPEYNQYANKKPFKGKGRIKLLEDTNNDGRYDKCTVFLDNLDSPSAVACWDGGVFVGVVPDIIFCKDTDGDGKADVKRKVYTGFKRDKAGEAMLNSFRWGLDNRFHVSTGLAGGEIRKSSDKKATAANVRGRGFLFDPRSGEFEVTSGGGQHGMSMDDWGRKFVCSNSEPIRMVQYDDRYLARNPYLKAPRADVNLAPEGKHTKLFRISRVEPWRILRTSLRSRGKIPGSDEGGKASGFFTAATGITIYRGDAWPEEHRGNVFVGEVSGNLIYRAKLIPKGVGFSAERVHKDVEFLASTDNWFRPTQFVDAPDGTLYALDFYRELIEGAAFLAPEVLKHVDPVAGHDRGRIYRIAPEKFTRRPTPKLSKASTKELVALLEHRDGWHRDTAARLLYQRQDTRAAPLLRKLVAESKFQQARLHALYALDGMSALRVEDVLPRLADDEARVREHAICLAEQFPEEPAIRAALAKLTMDKDPRVRYQLAFSLGALSGDVPRRAIIELIKKDGSEPWMQLALLSSLGNNPGNVFRALAEDAAALRLPHVRALLNKLASQIGTANRKGDVAALLQTTASLSNKNLQQEMIRSFLTGQPTGVRANLRQGKIADLLAEMITQARKNALDAKRSPEQRVEDVRSLGLTRFDDVQQIFASCLTPRQPQSVQRASLETLGRFSEAKVAPLILSAWPSLSASLRSTAGETLASRRVWITALLDAVENGKVARADLDPARIQLLRKHPNVEIRRRVSKLFTQTTRAEREAILVKYRKALDVDGDARQGKLAFKMHCAACHQLEGVGESIGADLSAIRDRGREAVLLNVLDPNREVKPKYLAYSLTTRGGRVLSGMIRAENANSITLRQLDGQEITILRIQVESLQSSGLSFMPEGLEKQIDVRTMADLLAYLESTN